MKFSYRCTKMSVMSLQERKQKHMRLYKNKTELRTVIVNLKYICAQKCKDSERKLSVQ
jgi:hypothetical protein